MQQSCTYGSVRGALGNRRPYRDRSRKHRFLWARLRSDNLHSLLLTEPRPKEAEHSPAFFSGLLVLLAFRFTEMKAGPFGV
jgi:hypothetical protein